MSLGGTADSFYEYLIKSYVMTSRNDTEGAELFFNSIKVRSDVGSTCMYHMYVRTYVLTDCMVVCSTMVNVHVYIRTYMYYVNTYAQISSVHYNNIMGNLCVRNTVCTHYQWCVLCNGECVYPFV